MRGKQDPPWTDDQVALLQRWWDERVTASAIAERLGVTRSAVLGKLNRLRRLAAGGAPTKEQKFNSVDGLSPHGSAPQSPAQRRCKHCEQSEKPHAEAKARGKQLLELTNNSCRWPLGHPASAKFAYCGVPEANLELGIAYCKRHRRRAYLTPRRPCRKEKLVLGPTGEPGPAAQT